MLITQSRVFHISGLYERRRCNQNLSSESQGPDGDMATNTNWRHHAVRFFIFETICLISANTISETVRHMMRLPATQLPTQYPIQQMHLHRLHLAHHS